MVIEAAEYHGMPSPGRALTIDSICWMRAAGWTLAPPCATGGAFSAFLPREMRYRDRAGRSSAPEAVAAPAGNWFTSVRKSLSCSERA